MPTRDGWMFADGVPIKNPSARLFLATELTAVSYWVT